MKKLFKSKLTKWTPTIVFVIILISIFSCFSIDDNIPQSLRIKNNDLRSIKKDIQEIIHKANPLNTTTWFPGETVYITFDNGSSNHYQSTYKYNAINNISHQLNIFIDFPYAPGGGHQNISTYAPIHWNLTLHNQSNRCTFQPDLVELSSNG